MKLNRKKGYVASRCERAFEAKLFDYLQKNNIRFKNLYKYGSNVDSDTVSIKYDLCIVNCGLDVCDKIEKDIDFSLSDYDEDECTMVGFLTLEQWYEDSDIQKVDDFIAEVERFTGKKLSGIDIKDYFQYCLETGIEGYLECIKNN